MYIDHVGVYTFRSAFGNSDLFLTGNRMFTLFLHSTVVNDFALFYPQVLHITVDTLLM